MFVASGLLFLGCILPTLAAPLESRAISPAIYDNLVFYFKYASSAYRISCPRPNGNTLVTKINNLLTSTQGFIARDDNRKEIVVSLRGSTSPKDFMTDANIFLTDFNSTGVSAPAGTRVHKGFLKAYNSVSDLIISTVRGQLADHPDYTLVTTGHSLGGALSSLTAASLKENFPGTTVTMYTYGQPRTGNPQYASWINEQFESRVFRGVSKLDGVPTMLPTFLGYRHHGVEYWSTKTSFIPSSAENTRQCAPDGEDATCSASIPSTGINPPHVWYYNIFTTTPFCA